ncbi:hypothetical protein [Aestuariivirga sp.]|uniref:hypothetical protein n=1 Tax=Aestuariivirga sp. TaxID=2650926 RepID=UPI0039E54C39
MPVISTATTTGVTLATNDFLAVTPSGSIVAPSASIDGTSGTGQTVSIAGYVEVLYLWMGGANTVNISQSGVFYGHGLGTDLFIGRDLNNVMTGGSMLNNAGMIVSEANGVRMFGDGNLLQNTGTITAELGTVTFSDGINSQIINGGSITSRASIAVGLYGDGDSILNTGLISSYNERAIFASGVNVRVENEGTVSASAGTLAAIWEQGANFSLRNGGLIDGGTARGVYAAGHDGFVINSGTIRGEAEGLVLAGFDGGIARNSGEITSAHGTGVVFSEDSSSGTVTFFNSGTVSGATVAIFGNAGLETVTNTGAIHGNVALNAGNDVFDGRGGTVIGTIDGGDGNDTLTGGISDDVLLGGVGNDFLRGMLGEDTLRGGLGKDRLAGGADADTFVYGTIGEAGKGTAGDIILDFQRGTDIIDLSLIDADATLAGNQAFTFVTGAFTAAGQIHFIAGTHILEGNINGNLAADFQITVNSVSTLTATDFIL